MNAGFQDSQPPFPQGNQGNIGRKREWDRQHNPNPLPRNRTADRGNNQGLPLQNSQHPYPQVKIEQDQGAFGNNIPRYSQQPYQQVKIEQNRGITGNRTIHENMPNFSSRNDLRINDPPHPRSRGNGYQNRNFEQGRSGFQRNDNFDLRNSGPQDKFQQNPPQHHSRSRSKFDFNDGRHLGDMHQNKPTYHGSASDFYSNYDRSRPTDKFQQNSSQFRHPEDDINFIATRSLPHNDFPQSETGFQPTSQNPDLHSGHSNRQRKIQPDQLPLPTSSDFNKPRLHDNLQHNPPRRPVVGDRARWSNSQDGQTPFQQKPFNDPLLSTTQTQPPFSDSFQGDISRAPSQEPKPGYQRQKKSKRVPAALAMF